MAANSTAVKNELESFIAAGTAMRETDVYGNTRAENLELGLYLVVETKVPENVTATCDPFMISLPMTSADGAAWNYDVTVYPKNATGMPTLEKGVREAAASTGKTQSYTEIATASDGDILEYCITSKLPSITSASTYLSEYRFADQLANGITYSKNDVIIEIFKDEACEDKVTTWDETSGKFTVSYDGNMMNIAMTADGLNEINRASTVYTTGINSGYSDCTMRITYAAKLTSDASVVCGSTGNPNTVTLTWKRTNADYSDSLILFVTALAVTVYPLIANALSEKYRSEIQTQYFEKVASMDTAEIDRVKDQAEKYNRLLAGGVVQNNYSDEALDLANVGYDALLNLNGDGIMAYVEVPALQIYLPVSHGTEAKTLEKSVGHVIGSSLPIGGSDTHCVLSGHSGMSDQKMFSDLNKLQAGDIFYIHVLSETLAYKVMCIDTVLPEDTSLLGIEAGKDMVTLVTCTPFGVNTHRLLVRGERTDYAEAAEEVAELEETQDASSTWTEEYWKGVVIGIVVLIVLILILSFLESKAGERRLKGK